MKIGLEVHVALPTKAKLFCSCSTEATEPNTAICPICMGLPGSKPMLNGKALEIAASIAKALNCKINDDTSFVRKVYFYPDLPKSYQITQMDDAVGVEGHLELGSKKVGIRRIQIEEDPAKIIREEGYTLLDFNRSGQPLVEIVTEPDIKSEEELREFLTELKSILYYLGVDIERELKVDLNISLAENRVEVKNITGMKGIIDATRYEIERQGRLIKEGKKVAMETRSYNEAKLATESSREKESEEEYGFIYEPDLTLYSTKGLGVTEPVYASRLAKEFAKRYNANENTIRELILFNRQSFGLMDYAKGKSDMKYIINGIELLSKYDKLGMDKEKFLKVLKVLETGAYPDEKMLSKIERNERIDLNKDAVKVEDIDKEISRLIRENSKLIEEYKKNPKVFNFIVGKVIGKYKANPKFVSERLQKIIEEYG